MARDSGFRLTPVWFITIVFCGLATYLVLRHSDNVTDVHVGSDGAGVKFGGGATVRASDPAKLEEVVERVKSGGPAPTIAPPSAVNAPEQRQLEAIARAVPRAPKGATISDFVGVWYQANGATYHIFTSGHDMLTFTEVSNLYGVSLQTAVGQGRILANRFEFTFNAITGFGGVGVLQPGTEPETLEGVVSSPQLGTQTALYLRR